MSTPNQPGSSPSQRSKSAGAKPGAHPGPDAAWQDHTSGTTRRIPIGRIAIFCSFAFSIALIGWAFSVGLRGGSRAPGATKASAAATSASLEYEAALSPEEYVDYARNLDRQLLDRTRNRSRLRTDLPSETDARAAWQKKIENKTRLLKQIQKDAGKQGLVPGTMQWQFAQELEAASQDAPLPR